MKNRAAQLVLTFGIALLAVPALAQTEESIANSTPAPVAYVYVQTTRGVNLYHAAATGTLTLVEGSPFKTVGSMAGSNGRYFFSLGTDWVRVYPVEANGKLGKQVNEINTQDYQNGQGYTCGTTVGAVLDHTGQNLYVALEGSTSHPEDACSQFEAFNITRGSGKLTFNGNTTIHWTSNLTVPAISGNDEFAYTFDPFSLGWKFNRQSNGQMQVLNFTLADPTGPQPGLYGENYEHYLVTPSPTNHVAMSILGNFSPNDFYLASYTLDSAGDLSSTNTLENMPSPTGFPMCLNMSQSGKLLAVGSHPYNSSPGGLQVFHFNGAEPITPYSAVLTSAPIDQIHWDKDNHLYALSYSTNQLFVYTITPTAINEVLGSPFTVTGAYGPSGLVVISK